MTCKICVVSVIKINKNNYYDNKNKNSNNSNLKIKFYIEIEKRKDTQQKGRNIIEREREIRGVPGEDAQGCCCSEESLQTCCICVC